MSIQQLREELTDKLEYFHWLVSDIETTVKLIEQMEMNGNDNQTILGQ